MSGVEDLQGGGSPEQLVPDSIPAIGVQETVPVAVGLEIEGQGPKPPVQVEMPVAQSAGGQVDEAGEDPVVQQDVGQAVIAVDQAVGFQVRAKRLQKGGGLRRGAEAPVVRKQAAVKIPGFTVAPGVFQPPGGEVRHRAAGGGGVVELPQQQGGGIAKSNWVVQIHGVQAILAGDPLRQQPVPVQALIGQNRGGQPQAVVKPGQLRFPAKGVPGGGF